MIRERFSRNQYQFDALISMDNLNSEDCLFHVSQLIGTCIKCWHHQYLFRLIWSSCQIPILNWCSKNLEVLLVFLVSKNNLLCQYVDVEQCIARRPKCVLLYFKQSIKETLFHSCIWNVGSWSKNYRKRSSRSKFETNVRKNCSTINNSPIKITTNMITELLAIFRSLSWNIWIREKQHLMQS